MLRMIGILETNQKILNVCMETILCNVFNTHFINRTKLLCGMQW